MIKRLMLTALAACCVAGTASAEMPVFAAKCGAGITTDTNPKGRVYINGKTAKVIKRPDGQISANSAGIWIDITPQGEREPIVTYTAKDKSTGTCEVLSFKAPGAAAPPGGGGAKASASERAGQRQFDATGNVGCAMAKGQPMGQCAFGVARDGGGTATVVITRPDGRTRAIFFEKGKAVSADLSQADGDMTFSATKDGDVFKIQAGHERYEIVEAVVFGG